MASQRIEENRQSSHKATGRVSGFIAEVFGAAQAVKVAGVEADVVTHLRDLNEERRKISLKDRLFNELLGSLFRQAGNLGTAVMLIVVGQAIHAHQFSIGDFALFVFFLQRMGETTAFMGMPVARFRQIGVSIERMERLMEGAPTDALIDLERVAIGDDCPGFCSSPVRTVPPLKDLAVHELSYSHPGSTNGIQNVEFSLRQGTLTVVTGRNGSGKTTLSRVLLGLLPKTTGTIHWNGQEVEEPGTLFAPPHCAYTAQIPRLFGTRLADNINLGLPDDKSALDQAARLAVMEDDLEHLELDWDTMVGPKGVKLSGGQLQRAAAARMFVRQADLLVFDDLSSALDVETEQILWERVFSHDQMTCLVVSHRRSVLRQADQILVMKDGQVHDCGKLEELLLRCEEMRQPWTGWGEHDDREEEQVSETA